MGNRTAKHVERKNGDIISTYYVRDAQSNIMASYTQTNTQEIALEEQPIYGSSRLGVYHPTTETGIVRGNRIYEGSNHLGNVLVTFSDRIVFENGDLKPATVSYSDYYAFGMPIKTRTNAARLYKSGFNGQVKDDEIYGEGNVYDLGFREYDSRIGRMFSIDPRSFEYPWQTTYAYHRNSPISMIDYLGGGDPEDTKSNSDDNSTTYKIKAGDTFWSLEKKWGLKHGTLTKMNSNLDPTKLREGQEINKPSQNSSGVSENIIIPPIKSEAPIQDNVKMTPIQRNSISYSGKDIRTQINETLDDMGSALNIAEIIYPNNKAIPVIGNLITFYTIGDNLYRGKYTDAAGQTVEFLAGTTGQTLLIINAIYQTDFGQYQLGAVEAEQAKYHIMKYQKSKTGSKEYYYHLERLRILEESMQKRANNLRHYQTTKIKTCDYTLCNYQINNQLQKQISQIEKHPPSVLKHG